MSLSFSIYIYIYIYMCDLVPQIAAEKEQANQQQVPNCSRSMAAIVSSLVLRVTRTTSILNTTCDPRLQPHQDKV